MRRVLKWVGIVVLVPILLVVLLAVLLYLPPVQNWAVKQVARVASEKTGMEITVEHVNLEFPLNLGVEGLRVLQPNDSLPQVKDTVADIRKLVVDVQLWPLFKKQVEIDALDFNGITFNTVGFIPDTRVKGHAGKLSLESHGIDLKAEELRINEALLADAQVLVELSDTVPPDTTESNNYWKIFVDKLNVERSDVAVRMPGDSLRVSAHLGATVAKDGYFDLFKGEYRVGNVDWKGGRLNYDQRFEPRTKGLDYNHLAFSDINIGIDSLYYCSPKLNLSIRNCSLKEQSGVEITELAGPVALDSTRIHLPDVKLRTPESSLDAHVVMDMDAFSPQSPGKIHISADGSFGKQDIMRFLGGMPTQFIRQWPNQPLTVKTVMAGNMKRMEFTGLNAKLPGAFNINAKGTLGNLDDLDRLQADISLDAKTQNLSFITALVDPKTMDGIRIPQGIGIKGRVKADGSRYTADIMATESRGRVYAKGSIDTKSMQYQASVTANNLQIKHFLPSYDMGDFTGNIDIKGAGTDVFSPKTQLNATAKVTKFSYGEYNLDGMDATATIGKGKVHADIVANNPLLQGLITLDALTGKKVLNATVAADLSHADLYNLHLVDEPMSVALCGHFDVATDMEDYYKVQGMASDITIRGKDDVYRPDDIVTDVLTRRDTTHAVVDCGDFHLDMDASGGYKQLMKVGDNLISEVKKQLGEKHIDQLALRKRFPVARIDLQTGHDNFFSRMLERHGYLLEKADIHMTTSPRDGLNGQIKMLSLLADSVQLDTLRLNFVSDSTNITFNGQVRNNIKNPQFVFNTLFDGFLMERGAGFNVRYYDAQDKLGVRLGAEAAMEENGIRLHLKSKDAVIAYRDAHINEDNYVFLADNRRVSANLDILAEDGTGVKLYSNDENEEALQDLTLSLNKLNLEEVISVIPYMPKVTGFVNGDYHIVQDGSHLTVSSSMDIDDLTYEGSMMGNLGMEFVYMPSDDGSHYVDGTLSVDHHEVGTVTGTYRSENNGYLDATLNLERLPISLVNGFIPDQLFGFNGYGEGEIRVRGALSKPAVDGEVFLDSCHLVSIPYGLDLRFSNDPVRIVGSRLLLENFEMYAYNDNPLNVAGNIDFSNLDRMTMNVRMRAQNFEIINAKENAKSVAFGRAFVNFYGAMSGPFDNLSLRGRLDVLGTTDVSYVLRDSPLTTDNQLDELVKFTDFSDTTQTIINRPPLTGFNMDLTMSVAKGAHVMAYLNAAHNNYIDLMGGGNLRMQYNTADNLRLTGRYTLDNGEMKYALPIIPLKTFTIQDGSYIEFTGDPMNPTLNITAVENTKATVSGANGIGRSVNFDCGVIITKTLNDMGLEFTLDAPEDMALHNELQTMSLEQRGKLAVTMLTTGMYLADGNTSGFSMNGALSSFLESEINQITGNALRTLDLSVNLDNATDASGAMHTDYSFKFAKRFWNNRVKITVGGLVSTGSDMANRNQSFFDNVSLEYRLDDTANKYLKLFFDNNSYDWLDGYTQQYGGGFIWRRTLQHFKDIFRFKSDQQPLPATSRPAGNFFRNDSSAVSVPLNEKSNVNSDSLKTNK
ncbi:MAG: translocation/assembly module TamB domain-containing protein [Prevotella sp.]|nr:translocation/assembly module TamB domain-containing protein [Prevotella sp.]